MESPPKSKRLSSANEYFLPNISESGENQFLSSNSVKIHEEVEANNKHKLDNSHVNYDDSPVEIPSIKIQRDATKLIVLDGEPMITTTVDSKKRVRKKSLDSDDIPKILGNVKDKACFKTGKIIQNLDTHEVRTNTGHTQTSKQSAIEKLVRAKSKDILSIIDKVKCVQKRNEPEEKLKMPPCTHTKCSPSDKENNQEKCLICDITNAAEKLTSIDSNRFLVEILYPHDYYDKYSRSRRKIMHLETSEQPMQVIKPVKAIRKRKLPVVLKMSENTNSGNAESNEGPTGVENIKENSGAITKDQTTPKSRLFGLKDEEKSTIHTKCREGTQAVFIIDGTNYEKPLLRGLKGSARKDHMWKERLDSQVSQSMYEVNSLGMQFALPEYNGALHNRKAGGSRQFHSLSSSANNLPLSQRHFTPDEGKRRITPLSRTLNRGLTFAGFDNDANSINSRFTAYQREMTNVKQNLHQTGLPLKLRGKVMEPSNKSTKPSNVLPPIETNNNISNGILSSENSSSVHIADKMV